MAELRHGWRAAAACLLVVLMTGCIKLNMDLQLQSDDTVNGSVIFALNKQLLELTGKSFDDLTGGQAVVPSGVPVQTTDYDDDEYSGKKYTFEDVPIARFSDDSSDGSLSIVHQGDTFVVSGTLDLSSADTSQIPDADQLLSTADISLTITFPGAVRSASAGGAISGDTVTWEPKFGEENHIEAVGSAIGSSGSSTLLWILIAAAVLIVVVVVVLLLMARRSREEAAPTEGDEMAVVGADPIAGSEAAAVPPPPPAPVAGAPAPTEPQATEPVEQPGSTETVEQPGPEPSGEDEPPPERPPS